MVWIILFLCLSDLCLVYTHNSDYLVIIRNSDCSTTYDLDHYESVILDYHGSDVLFSNPCSIEFTKSSHQKFICVSTERVVIDCLTKLEYHEAFVKNYIDPEKRLSCNDTSVKGDEWCPSQYQDNIFVVIRKPPSETYDVVKLRIYLKDGPESWKLSLRLSRVWPASIVPVAIITVVVAISISIKIRKKVPQSPRIVYQKTQETVQRGSQPLSEGNFQAQHSATPLVQSDYHSHLMQTTNPVAGTQSSARALVATAQMSDIDLPPSYDSVVGTNSSDFR